MGNIERKILKSKKGNEVLIRRGRAGDAKDIININVSVIAEKLYMMREPDEASYDEESFGKEIENYLHSPNHVYIVAETGKKVVGYIEFRSGYFRRTSHSGIFSMFILKEYREEGIGKMLLDAMTGWAEKNPSIEKITLAVFSTNLRAQALYKKSGFVEEGRCPKDMKLRDGSYIDSVLMYKFV